MSVYECVSDVCVCMCVAVEDIYRQIHTASVKWKQELMRGKGGSCEQGLDHRETDCVVTSISM